METQRSSPAARSEKGVESRGQRGITCQELTFEPMTMDKFSERGKGDRERVQR